MRVLVCGGRDYEDVEGGFQALDRLHFECRFTVVIEGGARGADWIAVRWAKIRGIDHLQFKADWKKYGPAAGPIRNGLMLADGEPDLVVAFPGGKGTANMVSLAKRAGVRVIEPLAPPAAAPNLEDDTP